MDTTKQTAEAERAAGPANADLNHKPGPREHKQRSPRGASYRAQSGKPTLKGDDMTTNKICFVIFGLLGLILLPVTGLWALFAYLAGDKYPLYALRGENVDDDPIDNP
jgi:hypothetical protein